MARITWQSITSAFNATSALNANFQKISDALDKLLARDGSSSNQMLAPLDMNGYKIQNLPSPVNPNDAARFQDITNGLTAANIGNNGAVADALGLGTNIAPSQRAVGAAFLNTVSGVTPQTTNFIANLSPAVINRINDRVFIGAATDNDAQFPNATKDWLSVFETTIGGRANGTIVSAQVAILNNGYFGAGQGLVTGVQTKNFISSTTGASGHSSIMVNNNTTLATAGWAFYGEAHRANDIVGSAIAAEYDTSNFGAYYAIDPYNQNAKMTVALQLAAGSEYPLAGQSDSSAAINIRNNPTSFGVGLVFGSSAIRGTDGVTGTGNAIGLATRHRITWFTAAGAEAGSFQSTITDVANKTRLAFIDQGLGVFGPTDTLIRVDRPVTNAVNYWDFSAGATGTSPVVAVTGSDVNIDLVIQPKGTGLLKFGTPTSFVANGSVATSLGSTGPTGAHTTVQKWLSVKDAFGTQYYIPCF